MVKKEESLNEKFSAVTTKTNEASLNFSQMVSASDTTIKSIEDVYSVETTKTKNALSNILSILKTKKTALNTKITEVENEKKIAESDLKDIEDETRRKKLA